MASVVCNKTTQQAAMSTVDDGHNTQLAMNVRYSVPPRRLSARPLMGSLMLRQVGGVHFHFFPSQARQGLHSLLNMYHCLAASPRVKGQCRRPVKPRHLVALFTCTATFSATSPI